MTFVFEARELPFDTVTDDYASRIDSLVQAHGLTQLPLWDRCLLAAVLPVVVQRRHAVAAAVAASLVSTAPPSRTPNSGGSSGGDVADAAEVHPHISTASPEQQNTVDHPHPDGSASLDGVQPVAQADIVVALSIVRQLDELEVVYDSILSARQEQQQQQQQPSASVMDVARQPPKTSEEILMEQLLQERFSESAPYLPESDDESGEEASQCDAAVDVAMCFTAKGESLGIGSAAVFGGHGYHP